MTATYRAPNPIVKFPGDNSTGGDYIYRLSFDSVLPSGVLLASITSSAATSGLTLANAAVDTSASTFDGVTYPANRTVKFDLSGGTSGTTYTVTIVAACTNGSKIEGQVSVEVQ